MLNKVLNIISTVLILGGTIFLVSFAGIEHRNLSFQSFSISITNPQEYPLITEDELLESMLAKFGEIEGRTLDSVPLYEIEQFFLSNPFVQNTYLYTTLNGEMFALVMLRTPLVRIINSFNESFLLDTLGVVMPLSENHPVRTLVATGWIEVEKDTIPAHIQELEQESIARDIFRISRLVYKDKFLNALISQIYVNEEGEIELIPAIGKQVIIMGDRELAEEKLHKLKAFYKQVMVHAGWEKYKTINLTFDNQVVCSK